MHKTTTKITDVHHVDFILPSAYKMKLYCAIFFFLLVAMSSLGYASEVVIVPSKEATPYIKAERALVKQLTGEGCTTQTIMLTELYQKFDSVIIKDTKVFVAVGSPAAIWLHKRIKPPFLLTYCMVADPNAAGLNQDPPVPGISIKVPIKSQFKLIAEALPKVRSIGVLYHSHRQKKEFLKIVKANLPKGWRLEAVAIDKQKTVAKAIKKLFNRDIDIVWTFPEPSIYNRATVQTLLLTSIRKNIPVFGYSLAFVKAGSLLGIAINPETQGQQAATLIHQLLSKQDQSPIISDADSKKETEPTENFEIALNLIVAEQLSIQLPKSIIKRAKHIFKRKNSKSGIEP